MKRYILSIIALVLFATTFYAQEQTAAATNDSVPALTKKELRKQKVARRNLHYNILGGPSYTPDFGAVLGGSALMTFRMNPSDTTQLRSVVPMAIAFMFNGGINLFSKPQLFFKGDRFTVTIPADEAYGEHLEELLMEVPVSEVPEDIKPEVGMMLQIATDDGDMEVQIVEVNDKVVVLDANHPLAGEDLTFDIEVIDVK